MSTLLQRCLPIAVLFGLVAVVQAAPAQLPKLSDSTPLSASSFDLLPSIGQTDGSTEAKRTVTTIVDADSEAEAITKAKKRYPKCTLKGVRKSGNHYIVTLECTS